MKNQHKFSSPLEEEKALIYNYSPVFRGNDAVFVQIYYFDWVWLTLDTIIPNVALE